jgi:uncharacterized membrane protein YqjE
MAMPDPATPDAQHAGVMQSLRNLAATALGVLKTRFDLLVSEIEEERLRIIELLVWGAAAMLFLAFGLMMLTFAVIVVFWETHRLLAAVVLGLFYLAIAAAFFLTARARLQRPRLFKASLEELAKDQDTLTSK